MCITVSEFVCVCVCVRACVCKYGREVSLVGGTREL